MRRAPSLQSQLGWWFAAALLTLYGLSAFLVWRNSGARARDTAVLTLKNEVERVAEYVRASGRLDAPELAESEQEPVPLWLRVVDGERVLAQTPGTPRLPAEERAEPTAVVTVSFTANPALYILVRHLVGGTAPGTVVEGIGSLAPVVRSQRRFGGSLVLVGLVVIPVAALGGRLLARRALRPLDHLVREIRGFDPARLETRLDLPAGSVEEVAVVARSFNGLLSRLEAALESMRRFTADASHEIRNPLSVLRAGIEVTLRRDRAPEEYRGLLRENLQEIERLQSVVEGILVLGREVRGAQYQLVKAPVDFSAVVTLTAATFAPLAAERGVRLEIDVEPEITVAGDERLLRLVAFNLLDNAMRHSPDNETVRVEARGEAGGARLVVADSGPGVRPEDRARLFQRFFRSGANAGSGVGGLGLSVVRWVTELHGGEARLLEADRGAVFEVTLPPHAPP